MAGLLDDWINQQQPMAGGLLNVDDMKRAQQAGLYGGLGRVAEALMAAGAPSRTPGGGFGSAFAAFPGGYAQAKGDSMNSAMKQKIAGQQFEKNALDLQAERNWAKLSDTGTGFASGTPQPNGEVVSPAGVTQPPGGNPTGIPGVPPSIMKVAGSLGRVKGGDLIAQYMMRDEDPSKFLKFESGNIYNMKMLDENGAPKLVGRYDAQAPWQYQSGTNGEIGVRPGALPAMGQVNFTESFNKAMGDAPWKVVPMQPGGGAIQPFGNMDIPPWAYPGGKPQTGAPGKMGALEGISGNDTLLGGPKGDALQAPPAMPMSRTLVAPNKNPPGTAENEYTKGMGGAFAKEHSTFIETGNRAADQLGYLQQLNGLRDLANQAGDDVNKLAPLKMRALAYADALGVDLGQSKDSLGAFQAIDAVSKRLVVQNIGAGGMPANNFSEADRKFITEMEQGLTDSGMGWELKAALSEKVLRRKMEVGNKVTEMFQDGAGPADIQKAVSAIKSQPIVTPQEINGFKMKAAQAIRADLDSGAISREQAETRLKKMGFK